jgi:hypothetical protein
MYGTYPVAHLTPYKIIFSVDKKSLNGLWTNQISRYIRCVDKTQCCHIVSRSILDLFRREGSGSASMKHCWNSSVIPPPPKLIERIDNWKGYNRRLCLDTFLSKFRFHSYLLCFPSYLCLASVICLLSRVWVTTDGVWIGNWIYWSISDRNYSAIANTHTAVHYSTH